MEGDRSTVHHLSRADSWNLGVRGHRGVGAVLVSAWRGLNGTRSLLRPDPKRPTSGRRPRRAGAGWVRDSRARPLGSRCSSRSGRWEQVRGWRRAQCRSVMGSASLGRSSPPKRSEEVAAAPAPGRWGPCGHSGMKRRARTESAKSPERLARVHRDVGKALCAIIFCLLYICLYRKMQIYKSTKERVRLDVSGYAPI